MVTMRIIIGSRVFLFGLCAAVAIIANQCTSAANENNTRNNFVSNYNTIQPCSTQDKGKSRSLRVVVSTTHLFFPLLVNWVSFYYSICGDISSLYIVCLDQEMGSLLTQHGMSCAKVFETTNHPSGEIKLQRTLAIAELLSQGYDVVHSDSDAIWLRNPFDLFQRYISTADIIASRDKGNSLCTGLMYIKASNYTSAVYYKMADMIVHSSSEHDQARLNTLLQNGGRAWLKEGVIAAFTHVERNEHFEFLNHSYSIVLLSYSKVARFCEEQDTTRAYVVHCYGVPASHNSSTHLQSKMQIHQQLAQSYGLWMLKPNWEQVPYTGNMTAYVNEITETHTVLGRPASSTSTRSSKTLPVKYPSKHTTSRSSSSSSSLKHSHSNSNSQKKSPKKKQKAPKWA